MSAKLRILIVEDEEPIRAGLVDLFVFHGYDVEATCDGHDGLRKSLSGAFDLVVLDVMLPGLDGFSICNAIRERSRSQAVILLTAKSTDEDIIAGLTLGADDYISKPFSVRELVLRAEAVLRRTAKRSEPGRHLQIGPLAIDTMALSATLHASPAAIALTRREVEILAYLFENSDRPVSREELLAEVWGYSRASQVETRTVDIHIAKLRRKIEADAQAPQLLRTVRGEGYRLFPEDAAPKSQS